MTYATLMVHLQAYQPAPGLMQIASSLAQRLNAGMIGIAARGQPAIIYNDGYVPAGSCNRTEKSWKRRSPRQKPHFEMY